MDRTLLTIPKLTSHNYHDWKFAVSMALRIRDCWDVIANGSEKKPAGDALTEWTKKANDALTIIALTVDPSQYTYIRDCTDGVTAWQRLKDIYEKNSRATRISLKRQFYGFEHDINMLMQVYVNGITDLAAKLNAIGVTLNDEDITDVLIFNLDKEYSSIAASLSAGKTDLKVGEVVSALLEEEQRKGGAPDVVTALYSNGINNNGRGPPGRRGPNRDRREGIIETRTCYLCGYKGHILKDCRATKTKDGKVITTQMTIAALERIKQEQEIVKSNYVSEIGETLNEFAY
ncbi:hypothetical protein NLJ89_g10636 [Agrocybe chaxingu]|uniref:CCHC-type domain-containing protein n=1 Tax=Agrocybe chaxingu TaxID=84603 RepID=A0A9W8JQR8_9AGAR|nr:hypothetical protein NLJ89_g10636 [Agrocybe chaxingu]